MSAWTADQLRKAIYLAANVEFDPEAHAYAANGKAYPSVTQILDAAGFGEWLRRIDAETLEYARTRGEAVHLATRYLDEGTLDWGTVSEPIKGCVEAYARWKRRSRFIPIAIEQPMVNSRLGFAGMPDRIGLIYGVPVIVDTKTGAESPAHALQLAGYAMLIPQATIARRFALYLRDDKTFRVKEFPLKDLARDTAAFRAALTIANWRNEQ